MATPGFEKRLHPLAFFDKAEATVTSAFYLERCRELRFVRAGRRWDDGCPSAEKLRFDAETSMIGRFGPDLFVIPSLIRDLGVLVYRGLL